MVAFPIIALADNDVADASWFADITAAVNSHETFLGSLVARKGSATPRSSTTTHAADPDLTLALPALTTWDFTSLLFVTSAANAAGDLAFQFAYPVGCTVDVGHLAVHDSIASGSTAGVEAAGTPNSTTSPTTAMAAGASTAITNVFVWGRITLGSTAGSLTLMWAQLASNANATTLGIGSNITARRAT